MSTHPLAHHDPERPRARRTSLRFSGTAVSALALALGLSACAGGANAPSSVNGDPKSATLLNVADETNAGGDPATAASLYRQLHDMSPKDPVPLARLATTFMTMQDYRAAATAWRAALALDKDNADFHRGLALALLMVGDAPGAMTELRAALAKHADDTRLYSLLGVAQDMVGRHDLAQQTYRSGIAMAPASAGLRNNYAMSLALSGDYGEAVAKLGEIAGPDASPRYRLNLALAYGLSGDDTKAAATAREVLDDASVQNNLTYYSLLRGMDQERRSAAIIGAELRGAAVSVAEAGAKPRTAALEQPVAPPPPVPVAAAPVPLLPTAQSGPVSQLPAERHVAALAKPKAAKAPISAPDDAKPTPQVAAVPAPSAAAAPAPLATQTSFTPPPQPVALGPTAELASDAMEAQPGFTPAPQSPPSPPEVANAAPPPAPDVKHAMPSSKTSSKTKHIATAAPTVVASAATGPQVGFVRAAPAQPAVPEAAPPVVTGQQAGFVPAPEAQPAPTPTAASDSAASPTGFVAGAQAEPVTPAATNSQAGFTPAPQTMPVTQAATDSQAGFTPAPQAKPVTEAATDSQAGFTPAPQAKPVTQAATDSQAGFTPAPQAKPVTQAATDPQGGFTPAPAAKQVVDDAPSIAHAAPQTSLADPEPAAAAAPEQPAMNSAPDMSGKQSNAMPAPPATGAAAEPSLPAPTAVAPVVPAKQTAATISTAHAGHVMVDRYAVQLGSYVLEESAHKVVETFTAKGIAVTLSRSNDKDGREWFVVRSRDFETAQDATSAMQMIQSMGGAQPVLVHHRVRAEASAPAA